MLQSLVYFCNKVKEDFEERDHFCYPKIKTGCILQIKSCYKSGKYFQLNYFFNSVNDEFIWLFTAFKLKAFLIISIRGKRASGLQC